MDLELLTVFKLPFKEQEKFFQNKLNIPTRKWDDLWKDQHAKGFMVAGAYKADLLSDFRTAVDKAITKGTTLEDFRKDFDSTVARHGWSYNGSRNWRSELIYSTNIRQAYNAGRWKQLTDPEQLQVLPYLTYKHGDSRFPRPHHLAWNGITLPASDPWWNDHFPQNGWGCKCRVYGSTPKEYEAARQVGRGEAPLSPIDPKTGEPVGIDKGFGYNVGKAQEKPYAILKSALDRYQEDIRRRFIDEMAHDTTRQGAFGAFIARYLERDRAEGYVAEIGWFDNSVLDFLKEKEIVPELPIIIANDKQLRHLLRPAKAKKGVALTIEEAKKIPLYIAAPEEILFDTENRNVLYVAPGETDVRASKVVVEVNYTLKKAGTVNLMVTAGKVQESNLRDGRYERITKR